MLCLMKLILEALKHLALFKKMVEMEFDSDEISQSEVVKQCPEWQIRRPIRYGVDK